MANNKNGPKTQSSFVTIFSLATVMIGSTVVTLPWGLNCKYFTFMLYHFCDYIIVYFPLYCFLFL